MELWSILVLALLKQGLNCDFDRLAELANKHLDVRRMLGLSDTFCDWHFCYRTLVRNVSLLTPDLLAAVNRLVVKGGPASGGPCGGGAAAGARRFVRREGIKLVHSRNPRLNRPGSCGAGTPLMAGN